MKCLLIAFPMSMTVIGTQWLGSKDQPMPEAAVQTYEHLATAIIEIRATENSLVKGILMHYLARARHYLTSADGPDRARYLEAAAAEVANIANEGNKQMQAIRQKLLKAGHHHNTDADTKEDYIFVDSREKVAFLALSRRIGEMAGKASEAECDALAEELDTLFATAMATQ